MHKLKFCLLMLTISVSFLSCLKDTPYLDVSNTQPIIEFAIGSSGAKDIGNFGIDPTSAKLDTAMALNIASPQVLDYPVTVTLKVDPSVVSKYNNVSGHTQLSALPDSTFQFKTTSVTIPAGYRIARVPITLFPNKISPSQSYGLPISIVSATGPNGQNLLVSSNAGVALYAFIGNPISGAYNWDFTRWSNPTQTGSPDGTSFTGKKTTFVTDNPTQVEVASGYYIGPKYIISFTNNGGTLSNFKVILNPDDVATMAGAGVIVTNGPNIIKADPVAGEFIFQYTTATRYVIDRYYR